MKQTIIIITVMLLSALNIFPQSNRIPESLMKEYNSLRKIDNCERKTVLEREIEKYTGSEKIDDNFLSGRLIENRSPEIYSGSDWYNSDVTVHTGDVNDVSPRPLSIKQGPDGRLYMMVGMKYSNPSLGVFRIYSSTSGGAVWSLVSQAFSNTEYFFSFNMLVESMNDNIGDSTRIIVYYTSGTISNGNDAKLNIYSVRRNGTSSFSGVINTPGPGRKFDQVTACSDGQYYSADTYMHVIVKECSNDGTYTNGFRHFRTINWGSTFINALHVTDTKDNYPTAQFYSKAGDSIIIGFERVYDANSIDIGIYATPSYPAPGISYKRAPALTSGSKYQKPCLTIAQQHFGIQKKILMTYSYQGRPAYIFSTNDGATWNLRYMTLNGSQCLNTFCASDTNEAAGNNFIIGYVNMGGDSVFTQKGNISSMSYSMTKINNVISSPVISPAACFYLNGNTRSSAVTFAGNSGINAYYDSEHLITGIENISNEIPQGFSLLQNYPNPFNPVTNIKFSIPQSGFVTLIVYDIAGREAAILVSQNLNAGTYKYDFNASRLSSGIYFYRIEAGNFTETKKMILVK